MSLLFNTLSRFVIPFQLSNKWPLIFWLQSPFAVILELKKIKSATVSSSIYHEVIGSSAMTLVFLMLIFKPTFSLSSFTLIKRLFSFSSFSTIRVVSYVYLILLIFLLTILILASMVSQKVRSLPVVKETWVQSMSWEDSLEKEMATHSSILAWKIQWTEEPGGLQFMGLQRVGHDWVTNTFTFILIPACKTYTQHFTWYALHRN